VFDLLSIESCPGTLVGQTTPRPGSFYKSLVHLPRLIDFVAIHPVSKLINGHVAAIQIEQQELYAINEVGNVEVTSFLICVTLHRNIMDF
jgi:hypothetical protein